MKMQVFDGTLSEMREKINGIPDEGQAARIVIYDKATGLQASVLSRPTLAEMQAKSAETLAYLQERSQNVLTDPEEIRQADEEFEELQRNLNRNRIEAGERPLFPE